MHILYTFSIVYISTNIFEKKFVIFLIIVVYYIYLLFISLRKMQKKYKTTHSNYLMPILNLYATKKGLILWLIVFLLGVIKTYIEMI